MTMLKIPSKGNSLFLSVSFKKKRTSKKFPRKKEKSRFNFHDTIEIKQLICEDV
jgi:hypothetical protein